MSYFQCIILSVAFGGIIIQGIYGARVTRSSDDPATYIVHFQTNVTDSQQQHFVKQLIRGQSKERFEAKIIATYPNLKRLTAMLSERAFKWVRIKC